MKFKNENVAIIEGVKERFDLNDAETLEFEDEKDLEQFLEQYYKGKDVTLLINDNVYFRINGEFKKAGEIIKEIDLVKEIIKPTISEEEQTAQEIKEESLLSFLGCENNDELLYKFKNSNSREIAELKQAFELIAEDRVIDNEIRLKDKRSLLDFLKFKIGFNEREEFIVIFLNNYNIMTGYEVLFKGTIDKSAIYPREIAERVFKYKAKGVIFAHNHPSGNLRPSKQDISITEHMQEFLNMIDVKLLEHVIVTKDGYFSFLEEGLI